MSSLAPDANVKDMFPDVRFVYLCDTPSIDTLMQHSYDQYLFRSIYEHLKSWKFIEMVHMLRLILSTATLSVFANLVRVLRYRRC